MRLLRLLLLAGLLAGLYVSNPTEADFGRSQATLRARSAGHALFSLPPRPPKVERRDDYRIASVFHVRVGRSSGDLRRYLGVAGVFVPLASVSSE